MATGHTYVGSSDFAPGKALSAIQCGGDGFHRLTHIDDHATPQPPRWTQADAQNIQFSIAILLADKGTDFCSSYVDSDDYPLWHGTRSPLFAELRFRAGSQKPEETVVIKWACNPDPGKRFLAPFLIQIRYALRRLKVQHLDSSDESTDKIQSVGLPGQAAVPAA